MNHFGVSIMSKEMNILYVVSEVVPFAKTGGLADVAGAFPQAIKELGHEIRVNIPKYATFSERKYRIHEVIRLKDIEIPLGNSKYKSSVKSAFIMNSKVKVQVYFLVNDKFYDRNGIYIDSNTKKDFNDNDERFAFFCKSTLETLKKLGWKPDIIHCNDWQTGLIPAYLKTIYKDDPFFKKTKTVFTIHNLAYQGIFPKESFDKTGLPNEIFNLHGVEFYGKINFMKAGIVYSDIITTVSEKYAQEIRTKEEYGCGLEKLLDKRKKDLIGIVNGVDYSIWDPSVDTQIPVKYNFSTISKKVENKKALAKKFGLEFNENVPIIGMISRLDDQKGFDLIEQSIKDLVKLNLQLVILGTGNKRYHELLQEWQKKYPKNIGIQLSYNEQIAHLIEAGSDMFLMPSKYEPCGLNQIYSLRYGTIPIVRATGGLDDTIEQFNSETEKGTGFKFVKYNGIDMIKSIKKAVQLYENKKLWCKLIKNGMSKDFSWEVSAKKYVSLYKKLIKE
jgi:starch synthase